MTLLDELNASQRDFMDVIWPVIADVCGGGQLIPVESVSQSGFARELDMFAGIDAWQLLDDRVAGAALRGIASRRQIGPTAWDTFTIRRSLASGNPTEYQKRKAALEDNSGYLYPHLTVQAYMDNGRLLSVGVAETRAVIGAVNHSNWRPNYRDGSTFFVVPFGAVNAVHITPNGSKATTTRLDGWW